MLTTDQQGQLETARQLLDDDKPRAALKLLSSLYKADEDNIELIEAVLDALCELKLYDKARQVLLRALKRRPKIVELWGRLVHVYLAEEDYDNALKALAKAEAVLPRHYELRRLQAFVHSERGDRDAMHQTLELLMTDHPDHRRDLLVERADLYRAIALRPALDEARVKDSLGVMAYAVVPLRKAIADVGRAIEIEPDDWHLYFKRAGIHKQLTEFDEAIDDFNRALEYLDSEAEDYREFVIEERDGCLYGGRNERESLAGTLREGMPSADDGELSLDDYMANNVMDALVDQHVEGGPMLELVEAMGDDPDEAIALSIAQDIIKQAREPAADYQPVEASEFCAANRAHCNRVEKQLAPLGYSPLGDFEPVGLRQMLGKRAIVRFFLAEDRRTSVAAVRFSPLKPALWLWLIMLVLRRWKSSNLIQLESMSDDGQFVITNNAGNLNPFSNTPDYVHVNTMPLKTNLGDLVAAHNQQRQKLGVGWSEMDGIEGVWACQEALRVAKNTHRANIGCITEAELFALLGKQYERFAVAVRKYLRLLTQAAR
ncbi:hypothetical protein QWI17_13680 [Gilvimarinus sp. SDUM040013]|uniref:Tetratricopeptide repeat protein n=1 Tax=Gilvimarinus gilvus TaxID=3058038 RepID=A0ABU4S2G1_9GAMM|nr:hypothetical protein [Gilvimarinus sp. SDUM040013]MDO3386892.1 hypothetical protein [Gilvimarinus sp. SDUM040013]MDX6851341.1 hypothetical protein [Gilvimarinus sp. SDUM040013]